MKVYCKNCKYKKYDSYCNPVNKYTSSVIYVTPINRIEKNRKGDCKDYSRIKWKFWVKDK